MKEELYIFAEALGKKRLCKLDRNLDRVQLAEMNVARTDITNSCVEFNGSIWVLGGYHDEIQPALNSVERYDPSEDKWSEMP